jgi:hypothetical protein
MSDLHIYFETGAIGDTALNLCRAHIAMCHYGHDGVIVHSSPTFRFGNPVQETPTSPVVAEILQRCHFIKDVVFDMRYGDKGSSTYSEKYSCKIDEPMIFRDQNDIKKYVDLTDFIPPIQISGKCALIQPISLRFKPVNHLDDYVPVWDRCVRALVEKGYRVFLVGGEDDPILRTMREDTLALCENMVGKWSQLESLAFAIYKAHYIVGCDSWASIWGPAAKIQTVAAWGYRMENDIDFWVTGFLGNRNFYKYGWSSQKEYCDAVLAAHIARTIRERGG